MTFGACSMTKKEVVLTGIGVLSPIGNDLETFWSALIAKKSGIGFLSIDTVDESLRPMGGEVPEFPIKELLKARKYQKNIKVMSRDIQLAYAASIFAANDANLVTDGENRSVASERLGIVFGSDLIGAEVDMQLDAYRRGIKNGAYHFNEWGNSVKAGDIFPLWMLKFLPNMPACHIAIAHDSRGPSNSVTLCRCSSLAAVFEACRTIDRGDADVMIVGGCGNRVNQDFQTRINSYFPAPRQSDPTRVPRPFDAERCGTVIGEGSAAFILESRDFAEARGAKIYGTIRGFAAATEPKLYETRPTGRAIRSAIRNVLKEAGLSPKDIGHVNADGLGVEHDDKIEAEAIHAELGDVFVTANKGHFGDLGSGTGAVELAASLLALKHGQVPPTRNHDETGKDCPIQVVHKQAVATPTPFVLKLNQTRIGRSFALIVEKG